MLKKEVNEANKSNFNLENNLISQLIEKFGKDRQIMQTLEEFSELQKELLKNINRGKDNKKEILEEFVDVTFMLRQIKAIYDFTDKEIQEELEAKMSKVAKLLQEVIMSQKKNKITKKERKAIKKLKSAYNIKTIVDNNNTTSEEKLDELEKAISNLIKL